MSLSMQYPLRSTVSRLVPAVIILVMQIVVLPVLHAGQGDADRGKHLYYKGERHNGESITANIGAASIPVPASTLPCSNCHGRDGKGRPEGGVIPSDIRWTRLSHPDGGESTVGRRFSEYDASSFLKAITEGVDSSGNKLDSSMPRFNLSRSDARDLVAYLKIIEDDFDPGITNDTITIGTLQPLMQPHARVSTAMTEVIDAWFDDINRQGGVYGRKLHLQKTTYQDEQYFASTADSLANDDKVFALLNAFTSTSDSIMTEIVENNRIPSFAPFTQFPTAEGGRFHYSFYLEGGLDSQLRVLLNRALDETRKTGRVYVIHHDASNIADLVDRIKNGPDKSNLKRVQWLPYNPGMLPAFSKLVKDRITKNDQLVFLGLVRELKQITSNDKAADRLKKIRLPGYFVTHDILQLPDSLTSRMELAYVTVPGDMKGTSLQEFRQFMQRHRLKADYLPMRIFAYHSTRTFVQAIKLSGKRINRDTFIESLESLHNFDIGTSAPIRFGSQRRVGLTGSRIVTIDPQKHRLEPVGDWVKLD